MKSIGGRLDEEWLIVVEPLDRSQCVALLEETKLKKRLSKLEVINYIILLINGFDSDIFAWDSNMRQFKISKTFAMKRLNSRPFQNYLGRFAPIGSMYRLMFESVELEFSRGKTFLAYQNALGKILIEIMEQTLEVKKKFTIKEANSGSDQRIRLLLFESFLDSDCNGNLLLSLRNLYQIHCEAMLDHRIMAEKIEQMFPIKTQIHRYYCRQILNAIHSRLAIPHVRIKSLAYTMLEHCLRPMFLMIESMLNNFSSISQLECNEFLFESKFRSDEQLYCTSYSADQMSTFWTDFLFIDDHFKSMKLFRFASLDTLNEAIKCNFSFRKNSLCSNLAKHSINILELFREKLSYHLELYADPANSTFDVEHDFQEETYRFEEPNILNLPERKAKKFQSFRLPLVTVYNMVDIVEYSLNDTFESIGRPIIQQFLPEIRFHYHKLFGYYVNFFLVQNPQHIWLYMHYLFPNLKDLLMMAKRQGSFSELEQSLKSIHKCLQDDPTNDNGLRFFKPHISCLDPIKPDETDFDWIMRSFDSFYYLPLFQNDVEDSENDSCNSAYNFWPITQMFNPKITQLFNELFQFIIRLRYFQYLIGNDFLLSSKFRFNDLEKNIYLFRFRLANLIFQFGRHMEYQLNELIQQTQQNFLNTSTIGDFFRAHQKFLERLQQINQRMLKSDFARNQFRTIAKFCHSNSIATNLANKLTDTLVKNRKMSIWKNIDKLDQVQEQDFSF